MTAHVTRTDVRGAVRVPADINQQIGWLHQDARLGVARAYVHNVVRDQGRASGRGAYRR